ncbi:MAG TPA: class IV adenylate cyclase [Methanococcaceae archaeon]|uniref:Class IV adenylate cyclase n=1 Tax=Methanothermococcus okinawensis TaxID=155863 RepID=A0A832ZL21_9EURY|nr:class IV adenylate cyclase [Methanococcaceae archaeon]HIP90816.1 class IV adenylate cyclase [Methanothermococcus okinawensis]
MIEVELKVRLNEEEVLNLPDKLKKLGFRRHGKEEEIDTYFNGIDRDFRKTDEALRVRKSMDLERGDTRYYLTYKGPRMDEISKTREEYQVGVEDGETLEVILEKLGFKKVLPIRKLREIYRRGDIVVSLDKVEGIGYFAEFEKTVKSPSEKEDAIKELMDIIRSLNIGEERLVRSSYLELRDNYEKER